MRKVTKKWTQKDGTKIRICDMSNQHLLNTIDFLERYSIKRMNYEHAKFLSYPEPSGEMAMDAYDQGLEQMAQESAEDYMPQIYWDLQNEKERRGLI
jgi:hypothetical protein